MSNVNSGMSIMLYFCSRDDNTDVIHIDVCANVMSEDTVIKKVLNVKTNLLLHNVTHNFINAHTTFIYNSN